MGIGTDGSSHRKPGGFGIRNIVIVNGIKRPSIRNIIRNSSAVIASGCLVFQPVAVLAQNTITPAAVIETGPATSANNQPTPNVRRVTAKVNGEVITGTDIDRRLALILAANQGQVSAEELNRLRAQVLNNLIDETLQIQEAKAQEIAVSQQDVNETYARVAQQNFGRDLNTMNAELVKMGSAPSSLKRQIEGELAWQRLQQRNIQPFVNVSEEEVNEVMARLQASKGTAEYRLGEIFLSATPANREAVAQNAAQIVQQLQQGGNFVAYARQYSEASTAAVGGDLGWIRLEQLPQQLGQAAVQMTANQLVGPIEIPGGFSILLMLDKRQILTADPRDAVVSLKQISLALPSGASQDRLNQMLDGFRQGVARMGGCANADAVAAEIGVEIVTNSQVQVRSLPGALQESILALQVGQTTAPFGSLEEGVRVLMLCDRQDPQAADGPSFDDIMFQLEEERVNKRAQRYLRDLRRDAIIEYN